MNARAIPPSATIAVTGDLVASEFGDELVMLDLRSGVYYGLEDVGARIWKLLLERPATVAEIRDTILTDYDVDIERCQLEITGLLAQLAEVGLVEIRNGPE